MIELGEEFKVGITVYKFSPSPSTLAFTLNYATSERKARISFPSLRVRLKFPPASRRLQEILGFQGRSLVCGTDSIAFYDHVVYELRNNMHKRTTDDCAPFWPREDESITEFDRSLWYLLSRDRWPDACVDGLEMADTVISKRCINMYFGDQSQFIYCDIASYAHVGDSFG